VDHTHALDLLRGEETKLNLLNGAQRRLGVWKENVRHDGDVFVEKPMKNAELTGQADGSWTGENEGALIAASQNLKETDLPEGWKSNLHVATMKRKSCGSSWPAEAFGSPCHEGAGDLGVPDVTKPKRREKRCARRGRA
jgi:hypothetical protein